MSLEFTRRRTYSRDRYYPTNASARAIVDLTGRKCLKDVELERLKWAGFEINVRDAKEIEDEKR